MDSMPAGTTTILPTLMSLQEAAQYLQVGEQTMRRYLDTTLKSCSVRVGHKRFVNAARLAEALTTGLPA